MEDIWNLIVGLIAAFVMGMAFHSTLAHYLPDEVRRNENKSRKKCSDAYPFLGVARYQAVWDEWYNRRFTVINSGGNSWQRSD